MPRTRTPPPLQPRGWEKSDQHFHMPITETEMLLWRAVFGGPEMIDSIRRFVNKEAYRLAGVSPEELPQEYKNSPVVFIQHRIIIELKRHKRRMEELSRMRKPGPKIGAKYKPRKNKAAEPVAA